MSETHPYDAHLPVPFGPLFYDVRDVRDVYALNIAHGVVQRWLPAPDLVRVFTLADEVCNSAQAAYHARQRAAA